MNVYKYMCVLIDACIYFCINASGGNVVHADSLQLVTPEMMGHYVYDFRPQHLGNGLDLIRSEAVD